MLWRNSTQLISKHITQRARLLLMVLIRTHTGLSCIFDAELRQKAEQCLRTLSKREFYLAISILFLAALSLEMYPEF